MIDYQKPYPSVSIIIPVFNEAKTIEANLGHFRALQVDGVELLFVDGGSHDGTVDLIEQAGFKLEKSRIGRAVQMNSGAVCTSGDFLLFLHVDTYFEAPIASILSALKDAPNWGFFTVALDRSDGIFAWIAKGINWRSKMWKVATGDQAIFVRRELFDSIGGFRELPLMEDIDITRRLKAQCRPTMVPLNVITSARRWAARGPIKTILLMWSMQLAFKLGVSASVLKTWYR